MKFFLSKSKKCVCGKNPVRADLFVRFFCGFLETASRSVVRRRPGARSFAAAAGRSAQFRLPAVALAKVGSNFVQQLQPTCALRRFGWRAKIPACF